MVRVRLDETGAVTEVSVYKSSDNLDLNHAVIEAARRSTYSPEIEDCRPVRGTYLFRADFVAASPEPEACPIAAAALIPTSDKTIWALLLTSARATVANVRLNLYAPNALYGAEAIHVNFTRKVNRGEAFSDTLRPFQADPIFIRFPDATAIDAASAETPASVSATCVPEYRSPHLAPRGWRDSENSATESQAAIAGQLTTQTPTVEAQLLSTLPAATCTVPYHDATVTYAQNPDYPAIAVEHGSTGTVVIIVGLSETGAVSNARIVVTSGSPYLDSAALDAAKKSRYSPQIFRCKAIGSYYEFRVNFGNP